MNSYYQILSWDSNFFGFKVVSITPNRLTILELEHLLTLLRQEDVSLVYWDSDPVDEVSQKAAIKLGGFLADTKILYSVNLNKLSGVFITSSNIYIEEYKENVACSDLLSLAVECGMYSRYKLDKFISSSKFEELYRLWIIKSVNRTLADAVFVARYNGRIIAMVTVSRKNKVGVIGLLAVDKSFRGKNVSKDLIITAHKWYLTQGCEIGRVTTQRVNHIACKFYEKCGYSVENISNYYHFWLKSI